MHLVVKESLVSCVEHITNYKRMTKTQHSRLLHELVSKAAPVFEYLYNKLSSKPTKTAPRLDSRSRIGVLQSQDALSDLSISEVMQVKPLRLQDLQATSGLWTEVQRDLVVEKVVLLLVSYFCTATELRFKYALEHNKSKLLEGKALHLKALEVGRALLEPDCALLVHFVSSFNKNFKSIDLKSDSSKLLQKTNHSSARSKSPLLRTNITTKPRTSSRPRSSSTKRGRVTKDVSPLRTSDQKPRKLTPIYQNLTDRVRQKTPERSVLTHSSSSISKPNVEEPRIDHSFMENFVLTSSVLYGDSFEGDLFQNHLENSAHIKKGHSNTGGHKLKTIKAVKKLRHEGRKLSGTGGQAASS
jgi:hypothetical protein